MTMTSGVTFNESGIVSGNDWLESYLNAPVSEKPGTNSQYNSLNSYVLSAIITERTGMHIDKYLKAKSLLERAIGDYTIIYGRNVRESTKGRWELFLRSVVWRELGQLYLNKGKWNGKQIIPESWAEASVSGLAEFLSRG